MKIINSLLLFLIFFISPSFAQQTFNSIKIKDLEMPSETASKVLYLDGSKKVKSSTTSSTDLADIAGIGARLTTDETNIATNTSNISTNTTNISTNTTNISTNATNLTTHTSATAAHGATGAVVGTTNTQTLTNKTLTSPVINTPTGIVKGDVGLGNVDNTSDLNKPVSTATATAISTESALTVHKAGSETITGDKLITGQLTTTSTTKGNRPCPSMTETQRNAVSSPSSGDCVFNSTSSALNVYNGSSWQAVGGGISAWVTSFTYAIGDIVIESNKIYKALLAHTSGTFATDLAASKWVQVSSVSGKAQAGSAVTIDEIQVPNNLLTPTATGKYLHESGNTNILNNGSFEHTTFNTGWTCTGITPVAETSILIDGKQAMVLPASASTFECYNDSTLYATWGAGAQFLASLMINTTATGTSLYVCPRNAGVTNTSTATMCVNVLGRNMNNGIWNTAEIPFKATSTSNGISIKGVAVTGNIYLDMGFVGPQKLKASMSAIGPWTTGTCTSTWTTNTTTTCKYRQVGDSAEIEFANTMTGAPNAAILSFNMPTGLTIDTAKLASVASQRIGVGTFTRSTFVDIFPIAATSSLVTMYYADSAAAFPQWVAMTASVPVAPISGNVITARITVPIVQFTASNSIYTSLNADTDWAACNFSTLAWQGLGTVTHTLLCKRQGGDLLMSGRINTGTATASAVQIPLPLWGGAQLVSGSTSKINSPYHFGGRIARNTITQNDYSALLVAGQSYLNAGVFNASGAGPHTALAGNSMIASSDVLWFEQVRIPIEGWENSNIMIGQYNGLESCADSYECENVYSAYVDTVGNIYNQNLTWITSGAVTDTSLATVTFKTGVFTVQPNCTITGVDTSTTAGIDYKITAGSSSSYSIRTGFTNTVSNFTKAAYPFFITCTKTGADYHGKTAKAVASDANVKSIGSVGVDVQSVYFGASPDCSTACFTGNCTICNQVGNKITSVPFVSTGQYNLIGIDGTKYNCTGTGYEPGTTKGHPALHIRTSSTASLARITMNGAGSNVNTGYNSITCIGIP